MAVDNRSRHDKRQMITLVLQLVAKRAMKLDHLLQEGLCN